MNTSSSAKPKVLQRRLVAAHVALVTLALGAASLGTFGLPQTRVTLTSLFAGTDVSGPLPVGAWVLLAAVVATLVGGCGLATVVFPRALGRDRTYTALSTIAGIGSLGSVALLAQHVAETGGGLRWHQSATALALPVYIVAPALLVGAVAAACVTLWRLVTRRTPTDSTCVRPATNGGGVPGSVAHWRKNTELPQKEANQRVQGGLGICVSGGGIRSATVALGALHSLRCGGLLRAAERIVCVSGGGYAVGALLLASQPLSAGDHRAGSPRANVGTLDARDVFAPGSPELDHLRRNGKYIASGFGGWARASLLVIRGLLISVVTMALVAFVAGRLLGALYVTAGLYGRLLPAPVRPSRNPLGADLVGPLRWSIVWALVAVTVLWLMQVSLSPSQDAGALGTRARAVQFLHGASALLLAATGILAVAGLFLPALARVAVLGSGNGPASDRVAPAVAGTSLASSLIALTVSTLWRRHSLLASAANAATREQSTVRRWLHGHAAGLVQRAIVIVAVAVIATCMLLLLGAGLGSTGPSLMAKERFGPLHDWQHWHVTLVLTVLLVFLACVPDQVRWSLHPFYKERLAHAFAVRRIKGANRGFTPTPYDYGREPTWLSTYGSFPGQPGEESSLPQVIFAAAVSTSGADLAPPGRRVVPFTFSHDFIGGPDTGWVETSAVEAAARRSFRRTEATDVRSGDAADRKRIPPVAADLTVQGAMAISGAAFASAMGREARPIQVLLALSNARLGSWLPNPAFLCHTATASSGWWTERLPQRRRLNSLLREVLGRYDPDAPLVHVTDGGHYENLGLVELLRHRPDAVICLDASGDAPGLAATIAKAQALAREDLGVELRLDHPERLAADSRAPLGSVRGDLGALATRFAADNVITGSVHYPDLGPGLQARVAPIVIGKATLHAGLPYDVLAYAAGHPEFPFDSTGDQWFDHAQFDAYHGLGLQLGEAVAEHDVLRSAAWPVTARPGRPGIRRWGRPVLTKADLTGTARRIARHFRRTRRL